MCSLKSKLIISLNKNNFDKKTKQLSWFDRRQLPGLQSICNKGEIIIVIIVITTTTNVIIIITTTIIIIIVVVVVVIIIIAANFAESRLSANVLLMLNVACY